MCAEYRLMQADMYNLFPAVGAVNAIRSNYNYELLPGVPNTFGTCEMKIDGRRAEPPERSRGEIARAMLYMEGAYAPVFRMSDRQRLPPELERAASCRAVGVHPRRTRREAPGQCQPRREGRLPEGWSDLSPLMAESGLARGRDPARSFKRELSSRSAPFRIRSSDG